MKKRTKIIILVLMVVLLGVTGYLNIALNNNVPTSGGNTTNIGYFAGYRDDREAARDKELAYYDAIIASSSSSQESIKEAEAKKLEIIDLIEQELVMEGLIKSKGFADAIVTHSASKINIIVKAKELTKAEVAQIVTIVQEQTGKDLVSIKIIPIE